MRFISVIATAVFATVCFAQDGSLVTPNTTPDVITKGATMLLKTPSFEKLRTDLTRVAADHKGLISDSKTNLSPKGRKYGWFRISVPADQAEGLMADIRPIAKVISEEAKTSNRKSEIDELNLRHQNVVNHIDRLKSSLGSRRSIKGSEILFMEERIFRAETDRDLLLNDRHKVEGSISSASIVVTAYEPGNDVTPAPSGTAKLSSGIVADVKHTILDAAGSVVALVKWVLFLIVAIPLFRIFKPTLVRGWAKFSGIFNEEKSKAAIDGNAS